MFVVLICISVSRCMASGKNGFVLPYYLPAHIMFAMLEIIETKVDKYGSSDISRDAAIMQCI